MVIMYSLFSRPLPGPSPTVPSVDSMQLFLGSVRLRASSWGTRPPFLPLLPSPRGARRLLTAVNAKGVFAQFLPILFTTTKWSWMSSTYSKCRVPEMLVSGKQEFQAKKGQFNHPTILGPIKSPKVFKKFKIRMI